MYTVFPIKEYLMVFLFTNARGWCYCCCWVSGSGLLTFEGHDGLLPEGLLLGLHPRGLPDDGAGGEDDWALKQVGVVAVSPSITRFSTCWLLTVHHCYVVIYHWFMGSRSYHCCE